MQLFNFHTHKSSSFNNEISIWNISVEDVEKYEGLCSVGVHPWDIREPEVIAQIESVRNRSLLGNVVAIGECGLDKLCNVDFALQVAVFEQMIVISETSQKPLILHCVKAFDELISLKNRYAPKQNWIIHGFRGNVIQAKQLLQTGFYFSFGAKYNSEAIKVLPLWTFFIETDDALECIADVYSKIATDRNISIEELSEAMKMNANNILKLKI
ncbi:MAG: TatD family hydrolase [Bacteroidales bacterium]|nr:TatD family hydrolase [Bacteroidales bacterium]